MRVGIGYDIHRLVRGRRLKLGGLLIASDRGLAGHSDGDAVLHALTDAILGAAALGDIGDHFSDRDKANAGRDSRDFVREALGMAARKGLRVHNADVIIIAERPKLAAYKEALRRSLAGLLGIAADRVGLQAKTHEKLGPIGRGHAIAVHAAVLMKEGGRK